MMTLSLREHRKLYCMQDFLPCSFSLVVADRDHLFLQNYCPTASPSTIMVKTFSVIIWEPPKCTQSYNSIGRNSSNHAWIYMANTDQVLLQMAVSAQSARLQGTKADILVLWFGKACANPCLVSALDKIGAQMRIVDPPLSAADAW